MYDCKMFVLIFTIMAFGVEGFHVSRLVSIERTGSKEFYYTANMANFETADQSCRDSFGGTIANIESDADAAAVIKLVQGQLVSQLWVNGRPKTAEGCDKFQKFNSSCWIWNNAEQAAIPENQWHSDARNRNQFTMSRAVLLLGSKLLDFGQNTDVNQFVCEFVTGACT